MPTKFLVRIRGENFFVQLEEKMAKYGFYGTRFIEAGQPEEAGRLAIELIRKELRNHVKNNPADPPTMHIEAITPLESFGNYEVPGTGFTWFHDDLYEDRTN